MTQRNPVCRTCGHERRKHFPERLMKRFWPVTKANVEGFFRPSKMNGTACAMPDCQDKRERGCQEYAG